MENDYLCDQIFGDEQLDCRGPVFKENELDDPIGDALTKQRLDFLAKSAVPLPAHVVARTNDEILGLSVGDELLKFEEPVVEHVQGNDLHKRAELSDEEVAEIKEYEEGHSVWS